MKYSKRLPLDRMSNCRDLGGYPTKFGSVTRFGVFVRSEAPVLLGERDINYLKEYGVKKSLDFRGNNNVESFPSSLDTDGIEYIHLPMFGRADAMGFEENVEEISRRFSGWGRTYIGWLESYKGWIKDVIHEIVTTDGVCQYNCNAGKDRTGIISALLLAVCGVDISDIAFDYCISRAMLKPRFSQLADQWDAYLKDENGNLIADHPFLFTPRDAMYQMFAYICSQYKTVEKYLYSCRISVDEVKKIREKLIGK